MKSALETKVIPARDLRSGMTLLFRKEKVPIERIKFEPRITPTDVVVQSKFGMRAIPFDIDEEVEVEAQNGSPTYGKSLPMNRL